MRTSKTAELTKEFENNNFNYPITWDSLGVIKVEGETKLSKSNKVFLLDESDSILVVGNPIYNDKIYSLYKRILKSNANEELITSNSKNVELCTNPFHAIGVVPPGSHNSEEFILENRTEDTLFIEEILKSCNCIDIKAESDTIPRNEKTKIELSFRADSLPGSFEYVVVIVFNNKTNQALRIQGFIND